MSYTLLERKIEIRTVMESNTVETNCCSGVPEKFETKQAAEKRALALGAGSNPIRIVVADSAFFIIEDDVRNQEYLSQPDRTSLIAFLTVHSSKIGTTKHRAWAYRQGNREWWIVDNDPLSSESSTAWQ